MTVTTSNQPDTPATPPNAGGQTNAERKLDIDRLEAVLQGVIVMLRDNPDLSVPWAVDISCKLDEAAYDQFLERHELKPFTNTPCLAYLEPLAEQYSAAEDRAGIYLPWTVGAGEAPE
jgi:hypothetical protein